MNPPDKGFSRTKKILQSFLGLPLTLLAFYFIGSFIYNSLDKVEMNFVPGNIILFIFGTIFLLGFFIIRATLWHKILELLEAPGDFIETSYLFSTSELKRYIPGNIFGFISRADKFKKRKVSVKKTIAGIALESLLFIVSSLVLSIPALYLYSYLLLERVSYDFIVLISVTALFLGSLSLYFFKKQLTKVLSEISISHKFLQLTHLFFLSLLGWMLFGLGNYFIASSFGSVSIDQIGLYISIFIFSWLIGYLSLITPMGLGIREGVIVAGLSAFMPLYLASSIAVLLRVSLIASELLFLVLLALIRKFRGVITPLFSRLSVYSLVLAVLIGFYSIYLSFFSIQKHNNFFTGKFDLGNMDQTVWNTLHGRFFMFTDPDGSGFISRFAYHSDIILVLFSPLYAIWADPRLLLIAQSVVLAFGAVFVYLLSKKVINNQLVALAFAISYLINPIVHRQNLYDFHPVTLATTFLIAAFYFILQKKWVWFGVFLTLSLLSKENVILIGALLGIFLIIRKRITLGLAVTSLCIALFLYVMRILIPHYRQGEEHFALDYLSEFGNSTLEIVINIILNPLKTIRVLWEHGSIYYLFRLLLPVGLLSILAPWYLIFAGPDILKNLLSSNENLRQFYYQYTAELIPFVYISAIFGASWLIKKFQFITPSFLFYYILAAALINSWLYGVIPGMSRPDLAIYTRPQEFSAEIRQYLSSIPHDAKIAAANSIGAHVAHREYLTVIPNGIEQADYVLFFLSDPYARPSQEAHAQILEELINSGNYSLDYSIGTFYALKKL